MKLFEHLFRCWAQHNNLNKYKRSPALNLVLLSLFGVASPVASSGQVIAVLPAATEASGPFQWGQASSVLKARQCDALPQYPLPKTKGKLEQALATANDAVENCLKHADFFAWRGALEFSLQRYTEATESLERALLLNPDLPGALLDFAQVLLIQGDVEGARSLLQLLSTRDDLPQYLQPILAQAQAQLITGSESLQTSATKLRLSTAISYDTNLNNAPTANLVTLTFPQGPITLPLDKEYQAKAGAAWLNSVQWQYARALGSQVILLSADLRSRITNNSSQTGYFQTGLAGYWMENPEASAQWIAQGNWGQLHFGGTRLYASDGLSLQRQWKTQLGDKVRHLCRLSAGAELEHRNYPSSHVLDGRYTGAIISATCVENSIQQDSLISKWLSQPQYGAVLRLGEERSRAVERPGGNSQRAELRLSLMVNMGRSKVSTDYSWARQLDQEGYSPLFNNGAKRNTMRQGLRVVASYPLKSSAWNGAELFVSAEMSLQKSNLTAFRTQQKTIMTGLTWELP